MTVEYFIVTREVSKEDLKILHRDNPEALRRGKIQRGEVGLKLIKPVQRSCIALVMLDGIPRGAEAILHQDYVEQISEQKAGLLLSLSDVEDRWKTYRSPLQMQAAAEIEAGCAVVYTKNKYVKNTEMVGMVMSVGKKKDNPGTWFAVEIFGPRSGIRDTEFQRQQLAVKPTPTKLVKAWDLAKCYELQELADAVRAYRKQFAKNRQQGTQGGVADSQATAVGRKGQAAEGSADLAAKGERARIMTCNGELVTGVVKWKGTTEHHGQVVGLEMDKPLKPHDVEGAMFLGNDLFTCPNDRRLYIPTTCLLPFGQLHKGKPSANRAERTDPKRLEKQPEAPLLGSRVCILLRNDELASGVVMWQGRQSRNDDAVLVGLKMDKEVHHAQVEDEVHVADRLLNVDRNRRVFCKVNALLPYEALDASQRRQEPGQRGNEHAIATAPGATGAEAIVKMEMQGFGMSQQEVLKEQEEALARIQKARAVKMQEAPFKQHNAVKLEPDVQHKTNRDKPVGEQPVRSRGAATDEEDVLRMEMQGFRQSQDEVLREQEEALAMIERARSAKKAATSAHERQQRYAEIPDQTNVGEGIDSSILDNMSPQELAAQKQALEALGRQRCVQDEPARMRSNPEPLDRGPVANDRDGYHRGRVDPDFDLSRGIRHLDIRSGDGSLPEDSPPSSRHVSSGCVSAAAFPTSHSRRADGDSDLHVNDRVRVDVKGVECTGSLMYLGRPKPNFTYDIAGIKLDDEFLDHGMSYGDFCGAWLFQCTEKRALFVKSSACRLTAASTRGHVQDGGPSATEKDALIAYSEICGKNRASGWQSLLSPFQLTAKDLLDRGILDAAGSDDYNLYSLLFHIVTLDPPPTLQRFVFVLRDSAPDGVAALVEKEARKDGRLTSIGAANSVQSVTSPPMRHTADVTTAYHTGEGVPYGTNNPSPGIYLPVEADTAAAFSAERDRCNEGILDVASTTTAGSQSQPYPRTDSSMLHLFDHVTFDLNGVQCTGSLLYLGRPTSAIKYDIAGIELDDPFISHGRSDGEFCGMRLFKCDDKRALFVKAATCRRIAL